MIALEVLHSASGRVGQKVAFRVMEGQHNVPGPDKKLGVRHNRPMENSYLRSRQVVGFGHILRGVIAERTSLRLNSIAPVGLEVQIGCDSSYLALSVVGIEQGRLA